MAEPTDETTVKFKLWAVLAFLTIIFAILTGQLFKANAERMDENKALEKRVTRMEVQYEQIISGMNRVATINERVVEEMNGIKNAFIRHEASSRVPNKKRPDE